MKTYIYFNVCRRQKFALQELLCNVRSFTLLVTCYSTIQRAQTVAFSWQQLSRRRATKTPLRTLPLLLKLVGNCDFRNENSTAFIRVTNPKIDVLLVTWKLDFKESTFSCAVSVGATGSVDCEQKLVSLILIKENLFKLDRNVYTVLSSPAFLMADIIIIILIIIIIIIIIIISTLQHMQGNRGTTGQKHWYEHVLKSVEKIKEAM